MIQFFGEKGHLQDILPLFEHRKEQVTIAEFLLECLTNQETAFIEAGTGIGKTLAYLVPTIIYALENDKKITLSTETKTLQQQIMYKDLPLVSKLLQAHGGYDFKYSLCLGSWNYPCIKRFNAVLARGSFSKSELKTVEKIQKLFDSRNIFTAFDVNASKRLWTEINRESDICDGFRCQHTSRCVYSRARREWNESTLLVMNHYLYFSNLAAGSTFLPRTDFAIFDEAHSLEEIISQQLRYTVSGGLIRDIIEPVNPQGRRNILHAIDDKKMVDQLAVSVPGVLAETESYFHKLESALKNQSAYTRLRECLPFGSELVKKLKDIILLLGDIDEDRISESGRVELEITRGKLFVLAEQLTVFVFQNLDNYVYWIERGPDSLIGNVTAKCQPVEVAGIVESDFGAFDSCFFVSATLTINNEFGYIAGKLGIRNYRTLLLESSFDYMSQLILYIDKTIGEPDRAQYAEKSADLSSEIVSLLDGNCLILFTSYRMLGEIKNMLRDRSDREIFSQDELSSTEAIAEFIENQNSILMGTHSFWQGIDLPGDLLRGVIMARLPFSVPDSPPMEAKIELITGRGGNPFYHLQVPEAILKFKQGFGRLIRSKTDMGIVAVLDSRILTKPYGKLFLRSIPQCKIVYTFEDVEREYRQRVGRGD